MVKLMHGLEGESGACFSLNDILVVTQSLLLSGQVTRADEDAARRGVLGALDRRTGASGRATCGQKRRATRPAGGSEAKKARAIKRQSAERQASPGGQEKMV